MHDDRSAGGAEAAVAGYEATLARSIDAIGTPEFIPAVLDHLRSQVAFLGAFVVLIDGRRPPTHLYDNVRAERRAEVVDRYLKGAYLLDPFYLAGVESGGDRVLALPQVAPDRFQQTDYYRRYYGLLELRDELALLVDLGGERRLFYSVGRRAGEPRFTRRQVATLRRALPVFAALNRRHFAGPHYSQLGAGQGLTGESVRQALERFGRTSLTAREQEIATLILRGHSSSSIAGLIGISPGTVKIHRKNIYRKLEISSQSELFLRFLEIIG